MPEKEWEADIKQTMFQGSQVMEEVVFFHNRSQTLILTDLTENFHPIAWMTGILLNTMLDWKPENIILAHGECVMGGGFSFLKKSFKWLK